MERIERTILTGIKKFLTTVKHAREVQRVIATALKLSKCIYLFIFLRDELLINETVHWRGEKIHYARLGLDGIKERSLFCEANEADKG